MAVTGNDLEQFIRRWYELWNDQDRLCWLQHWKDRAPGEPTLEDPVGTPVNRGWEIPPTDSGPRERATQPE